MSKYLPELQQEKNVLVAQADGILERAKLAGRGLTAPETKEFDSIMSSVKQLNEDMKTAFLSRPTLPMEPHMRAEVPAAQSSMPRSLAYANLTTPSVPETSTLSVRRTALAPCSRSR